MARGPRNELGGCVASGLFVALIGDATRRVQYWVAVYSTCLFCHASLGTNQVIERFPVGRRLAFDGAKGRLWVVCGKCTGWNLTPVEERWEAIEECERRFRGTRLRVSTDHVGLTKLSEGLELVRIGNPLRPELALWRYGQRVMHRRWRTAATTTAAAGGFAVVGLSSVFGHLGVIPLLAGGATGSMIMNGLNLGRAYWHSVRVAFRVTDSRGEVSHVTQAQAECAEVQDWGEEGWQLAIPRKRYGGLSLQQSVRRRLYPLERSSGGAEAKLLVTGPDALRAAAVILPHINRWGATRSKVADAAALLDAHSADDLFRRISTRARTYAFQALLLKDAGPAVRLALEMAAHEETERRAMEGELAELEAAWRDAEEIAAIADNMFLPNFVVDFIQRQRNRGSATSA